jgi:RND family efflux transporter MFP subunit
MKKTIPLLCLVLIIVVAGCKGKIKPGPVEIKRQVVTGVVIEKILLSRVDAYYETSGTVKAKTTSIVASRVMGTVTDVKVREGSQVKAGDVLILIDDRDMAQKMAAAEAGYKEALNALESARQNKSLAEATYRRYKNLYEEKVISGQEMDQVETGKKVAESEYERVNEMANRTKASLEEARVYYGFTKITAPVSGIVTGKSIDRGSMAVPGVPLLIIEDTSQFKIEAYIDESLSGKFKIGTLAYIVLGTTGERIEGTIGELVPAVDPASRTSLIRVYVKAPSLRAGIYSKILIPVGKKDVIIVPKKAISERGQLTGVYAVDEKGIMTYHLVKTGKLYGEKVEVLSGLKSGENIVVGGMENAVDGAMVKQ